LTIKGPA